MLTRGFSLFLAFLRIATGLSLFASGLRKLGWFAHPALEQIFVAWSAHPANGLVATYLRVVTPHHAFLARVVVLGELTLGMLLILGLMTPLASLLAFFMVLNFQLAGSSMFAGDYFRGQSGFAYLLIFPVLFFGRAGTSLGLDGLIARARRQAPD
jgi:uncharacterized membrane protein YphA (DoxX/SURF4 family)